MNFKPIEKGKLGPREKRRQKGECESSSDHKLGSPTVRACWGQRGMMVAYILLGRKQHKTVSGTCGWGRSREMADLSHPALRGFPS